MSCNVDYNFLALFQKTVDCLFVSSNEIVHPQTDAHITDAYTGYITELQNLGQAATAPGSRDMVASPYPTRMRCLTDMEEIKKAKQVLVEKIEFSPIDSMLDAGTGQDTATVAAIRNSRTGNSIYGQSMFRNGIPNNWQPNWFRPEVWVNGINILGNIKINYFKSTNKGDLSFGFRCPKCFDKWMLFGEIKKFEIFAQLVQYIPDSSGNKFQRYPLMAEVTFRLRDSLIAG